MLGCSTTISRYSQKLPSQCCSRKCVLSRRLSTSEINGFVFVGIVDSPNFQRLEGGHSYPLLEGGHSCPLVSLNLPVCFVYRKTPLQARHTAQPFQPIASGNSGPSIKSDTHLSQGLRQFFSRWRSNAVTHLFIRSKSRTSFSQLIPTTRIRPRFGLQ